MRAYACPLALWTLAWAALTLRVRAHQSIHMGVCYDHRAMDKKWKGRINMLYLGHFTTEEECARVVAQAREKIARESYPQNATSAQTAHHPLPVKSGASRDKTPRHHRAPPPPPAGPPPPPPPPPPPEDGAELSSYAHAAVTTRGSPRGAQSEYRGVCWDKNRKAWKGRVGVGNGASKYLGYFDDEIECAEACDAEVIRHGAQAAPQ
jgi:hypothetical protein